MRSQQNPTPDRLPYARVFAVVSAVLAVPLLVAVVTTPPLLAVIVTVTLVVALPAALIGVVTRSAVVLSRLSAREKDDTSGGRNGGETGRCPPATTDHAD